MDVVCANNGLLTNVEVLEVIQENRERRKSSGNEQSELQNRDVVESKAIRYISQSKAGSDSSSNVEKCMRQIKDLNLGLLEAEIVQIANMCPESEVEFYLIIEECSDRLSPEQIESIRSIISSTLSCGSNSNDANPS